MNITAKELKQGKTSVWETTDKDDHRIAEVSFNPKTGMFLIWFNGAFIWSGKAFKGLTERFETLRIKWDLRFFNIQ